MPALLPAELAWYVTGRFYADSQGNLADYGYFLHLGSVEGKLFDPARGEASAHFTFAAQPFQARSVQNGPLQLALDPASDFSIYLQQEPAGDFADPQSFARGECIATLRRTSVVAGTTVDKGDSAHAPALISSNVFSARLISSTPFTFDGRRYDLAQIFGQGVTQFGTAAAAPVTPVPAGYAQVFAFSGSALALGA
jgi:hypothetical protein